jgi:hypothetical protein
MPPRLCATNTIGSWLFVSPRPIDFVGNPSPRSQAPTQFDWRNLGHAAIWYSGFLLGIKTQSHRHCIHTSTLLRRECRASGTRRARTALSKNLPRPGSWRPRWTTCFGRRISQNFVCLSSMSSMSCFSRRLLARPPKCGGDRPAGRARRRCCISSVRALARRGHSILNPVRPARDVFAATKLGKTDTANVRHGCRR